MAAPHEPKDEAKWHGFPKLYYSIVMGRRHFNLIKLETRVLEKRFLLSDLLVQSRPGYLENSSRLDFRGSHLFEGVGLLLI